MSEQHAEASSHLKKVVMVRLSELGKGFKTVVDGLKEECRRSRETVTETSKSLDHAKKKHASLLKKLNLPAGISPFRKQANVPQKYIDRYEASVESVVEAHSLEYTARNKHHQVVITSLEKYNTMDLVRVADTKHVLQAICREWNESHATMTTRCSQALSKFKHVNQRSDIEEFIEPRRSGLTCPWLVPVVTPTISRPTSAKKAAAAPLVRSPSSETVFSKPRKHFRGDSTVYEPAKHTPDRGFLASQLAAIGGKGAASTPVRRNPFHRGQSGIADFVEAVEKKVERMDELRHKHRQHHHQQQQTSDAGSKPETDRLGGSHITGQLPKGMHTSTVSIGNLSSISPQEAVIPMSLTMRELYIQGGSGSSSLKNGGTLWLPDGIDPKQSVPIDLSSKQWSVAAVELLLLASFCAPVMWEREDALMKGEFASSAPTVIVASGGDTSAGRTRSCDAITVLDTIRVQSGLTGSEYTALRSQIQKHLSTHFSGSSRVSFIGDANRRVSLLLGANPANFQRRAEFVDFFRRQLSVLCTHILWCGKRAMDTSVLSTSKLKSAEKSLFRHCDRISKLLRAGRFSLDRKFRVFERVWRGRGETKRLYPKAWYSVGADCIVL